MYVLPLVLLVVAHRMFMYGLVGTVYRTLR
jgi:hypothetical protein